MRTRNISGALAASAATVTPHPARPYELAKLASTLTPVNSQELAAILASDSPLRPASSSCGTAVDYHDQHQHVEE